MPYSRDEVAYAAGLFEGEGSCTKQRHYWNKQGERVARKTPQRMLTMGMTDREPLERMQGAFGGTIYGPYDAKQENWKPHWQWDLWTFEFVQAATAAMWEFLSPRRREQLANLMGGE